MSVIFGIFNRNGKPVEEKTVNTMLDVMSHWKPDDSGTWLDGSIALGHTMLWNTPESKFEHLPNRQNNLVITMDARLDNREELAEKLDLPDRPLEQVTDSDFILAAYQKWGEECPKQIIGDFSFVIWDEKKKQLFCARDHLGIRPFYYHHPYDDHFAFSSEIDSLLAIKEIPIEENPEAIASFVCRTTVGYDQTMYKDIMRLPMGSWMVLKDGSLHIERYWQPEKIKPNKQITFQEASKKVKKLFDEAVSARLRSYGEIGCELSGGIDSSSVICTAAKLSPEKKIIPFSLRYGDYDCDEGQYIDEVTKKLGVDTISIRVDEMDYTDQYDMGFNYRINKHWPLYVTFTQSFPLVEKMRERGVRVLLTGQGGDHLFEGSIDMITDFFTTYQFGKLFRELKQYKSLRKAIIHFLISPFLPAKIKKSLKKILVFLRIMKEGDKGTLFNEEKCIKPYDITDDKQFHSRAFKNDIVSIASNMYAMWIDSFSYCFFEQHYGVEVRHPFFDVRLVEFVLSLPPEYKLRERIGKVVLRESMKGVLPEKVRLREDKAEFSKVILDQLHAIDIDQLIKDSEAVRRGYISRNDLEKIRSSYHEEKNLLIFWQIVNFEYWYKKTFINNKSYFML